MAASFVAVRGREGFQAASYFFDHAVLQLCPYQDPSARFMLIGAKYGSVANRHISSNFINPCHKPYDFK